MELKKGMYVRTKDGYIAKCTYIDTELENIYGFDGAIRKSFGDEYDFIYCKEQEEHIIKASHNIIDLIEVGDYVNGNEVIQIKDNKIYFNDYAEEPENIKSIVTKEQFKAMEYKID